MKKICTKCNIEKSLDDFSKNSTGKFGRSSWCKKCSAAHKREYRFANRTYVNAMILKRKAMNRGLAVLGIWFGVGMVGMFDHTGIIGVVAVCAMFATFAVASHS